MADVSLEMIWALLPLMGVVCRFRPAWEPITSSIFITGVAGVVLGTGSWLLRCWAVASDWSSSRVCLQRTSLKGVVLCQGYLPRGEAVDVMFLGWFFVRLLVESRRIIL